MTDEEYIKAAITLAEGWRLNRFDGDLVVIDGLRLGWPTHRLVDDKVWARPVLDALAAQLVRQVDATNEYLFASAYPGWSSVVPKGNHSTPLATHEGSDRTMNTLKCIVDSGVLQQE